MAWHPFRPRGQVMPTVEQAGSIGSTPTPRLDSHGGDGNFLGSSYFALDGPTPVHIEWLFGLCDEWARTCVRLRMEVWRQGLLIEPLHPKFCSVCEEGIDDDKLPCPGCGGEGTGVAPDPSERSKLKDVLKQANFTYRENLVAVGERKTEEGLKHGRSYVVYKLDLELDADGRVTSSVVRGVFVAESARMVRLPPQSVFICLRCRSNGENYNPEKRPGRCGCGYVLYEAAFAQNKSILSGPHEWYFLFEEVHETKWPYTDGTPPIRRLWPKASTLLAMDWYASWALDPKKEKRPDRILVTMGGDLKSIVAQLKANAQERLKNPYAYAHLHIPSPPGGLTDQKLGAEILDFGDKEFKGQMMELRQEFESAMRKHYGLSATQAGDTDETGGGIGETKGTQVRATAQVAEDIQKAEHEWLVRLSQKLGCRQWTFKFPPALEENGAAVADELGKWLDVGIKAAGANLIVEWRADKPHIQDGRIMPPMMPPIGDQGGDGPPGQAKGKTFPAEASE